MKQLKTNDKGKILKSARGGGKDTCTEELK